MLLDTEKLTFGADLSSHAAKAISTLRPVFRLYILALDFAQLPSRTGLPHSLSLRSFSFPLSNVHQGISGGTSGSLDVTLNLVEYCKTETQMGVTCYFTVKTRQEKVRAKCRESDLWIQ